LNRNLSRRDFVKIGATAGAGVVASGMVSPLKSNAQKSGKIKVGFVGVGDQGSSHLDMALGMDEVEVPALCDIKNDYLYRAKLWVEDSGRPSPRLYGKTRTDFERMIESEDLDLVVCCTSWEWHAPVLLSAMRNDKNAVSEVPLIIKLDEAWEIVETYEKTGKWGTLISKGGPSGLVNMIHQGVLGNIVFCRSGYIHDLRLVKNDPEREPWRLAHSRDRNGNLYPDHPASRIMPIMDINHGDRFDFIVSVSSSATMLNEYADLNYGPDHPYAKQKMAQGDYNASIIRTVNGKVFNINFDTNTPHPRGITKIQGTKGAYISGEGVANMAEGSGGRGRGGLIYLDGISPESHRWEDAGPYLKEYEHPIVKNYVPKQRSQATRGHSGGSTTISLTWHRLVQAVLKNDITDFDVYDSVTSSAIGPLSEMSVSSGSTPVEFPDFTRGNWQKARTDHSRI
jgi:hypothetical protein